MQTLSAKMRDTGRMADSTAADGSGGQGAHRQRATDAADPQRIAERSALAMWRGDNATRDAGITVRQVGPGTAVVTLTVTERHLNGHAMCHGGVIFTLADTAFAFACNSRNRIAVAQHNSITYLSPGRPGETLTATAHEVALAGRSGIYDVAVTGEDGRMVARFQGLSRIIQGTHFDPDSPDPGGTLPLVPPDTARTMP